MPPRATKSQGKRPAAGEEDEPAPKKHKGGKRSGAGAPSKVQQAAVTALSGGKQRSVADMLGARSPTPIVVPAKRPKLGFAAAAGGGSARVSSGNGSEAIAFTSFDDFSQAWNEEAEDSPWHQQQRRRRPWRWH